MRARRLIPAVLVVLGLSACGGEGPTASGADVSPRFSEGGLGSGNGGRTQATGGITSTEPTGGGTSAADTTAAARGGWIGSGT